MKKAFNIFTITLTFCLFIYQNAHSQIDFGTKIGASSTSVSGNNNFSGKSRYSYQAGLYLSFDAPLLIGVQTEVLYNRTVFENIKPVNGLATGKKKMGYWSLPVLVQIRPVSFIKIGAGPQWNINANTSKYKLDNKEKAFKNYLSFVANFQIKVSTATQLSFRYNKGLKTFENLNDGHTGKINRFEFGIMQSISH